LILQEEVKGKGGKEAALVIQERLTGLFKPALTKADYEV
jgi:hypothetical protein